MRKRVASEMTLHQSVVMLEDSFDSRRGEAKDAIRVAAAALRRRVDACSPQ
jgi:hypothetical protein